jgi:hypothetical protein
MKVLYLIACGLFLTGITMELIAKRHASIATKASAESATLAPSEKMKAQEQSEAAIRKGNTFGVVGLVAAVLGLGAWLGSFAKGKHEGKRLTLVVQLVLAIAYAMLWFLMA